MLIKRIVNYFKQARTLDRVNMALTRSAYTATSRSIHEQLPETWEFCGFSQNGEDGIIDYLLSQLLASNRYFVEIGAADGLENNTTLLAIAKKYSGLMIEGSPKLYQRLKQFIPHYNLGVEVMNCFVTKDNVAEMMQHIPYADPDLFSLDIDGNDLHVLKAFLLQGLKPKIIVVEYNSAFGTDNACTIPYQANFDFTKAHQSGLYYGVSIRAWHNLLAQFNYRFVTVDTNGVNGFFIHPDYFTSNFVQQLKPIAFKENFFQLKRWKTTWQKQFELIKDMPLEEVSDVRI